MSDRRFISERVMMLDLWLVLGAPSVEFDAWYDDPKRTRADAWAQLLGAVAGIDLSLDTNPPAGDTLVEIAERRSLVQRLLGAALREAVDE